MKRRINKAGILIITMTMLLSLVACEKNKDNLDAAKQGDTVEATSDTEQSAEPTTEATMEASATEEPVVEEEPIKELTYQDFDSFQPIREVAIPCTFESKEENDNQNTTYEATGSYDLNQDGTDDTILFKHDSDTYEYSLQINEANITDFMATPECFYIVDLDKRDTYQELVIYDNGMSDDPCFNFYRYDGNNLVLLGMIGSLSDSTISFDGYGRIVKGDSLLNRLSPSIIPAFYEVEKNELKMHDFDLSEVLNQEYSLSVDENAYFCETDQVGEDFIPDWSENMQDYEINLKAGDKIMVKGIYDSERYWVVLPDGRSGMLYYWIGD
ncbi:hypothetical protein [Anaerosporobacter faecicola]|uniref:hypothetical protein n=1 Tax=Anaerosporobacter faecicola TaxID=2718714 RepID=UPI0014398C1B|nr:hypothetical protein [Anaerosporobacter faecicola]